MLTAIIGWIPAAIFPGASALQLYKLLKHRKAGGVSAVSWLLFAAANVGAYIFTEKYTSPQTILAFLLTAVLNLLVTLTAWEYKD